MISCNNLQCCSIIASQQKTINSLNFIRHNEKQSFDSRNDFLKKQVVELQAKLKVLECYSVQQKEQILKLEIEKAQVENKVTVSNKKANYLENELISLRKFTLFLKFEINNQKKSCTYQFNENITKLTEDISYIINERKFPEAYVDILKEKAVNNKKLLIAHVMKYNNIVDEYNLIQEEYKKCAKHEICKPTTPQEKAFIIGCNIIHYSRNICAINLNQSQELHNLKNALKSQHIKNDLIMKQLRNFEKYVMYILIDKEELNAANIALQRDNIAMFSTISPHN